MNNDNRNMVRCIMAALFALTVLALLAGSFDQAYGFTPPSRDVWYYRQANGGLEFQVPDKAQHYYGSALLAQANSKLIGNKIIGHAAALVQGFLWECNDNKHGRAFSVRDLYADGLGVLTSFIGWRGNVRLFCDYDTQAETITLNVSVLVK